MRERFGNVMRCFTAAIADAALASLLIALMLALYDIERTYTLAAGIWALTLLVQAIINELLAPRGPSLLVYGGVNTALLLVGRHYVLAHTAFIPGSGGFPVLLGVLVFVSGMHSAYAAQHLPGSDVFVRLTDALIASTALYLITTFFMGKAFNTGVLMFVFAAFALLLVMTASLRAGGESDSVVRGAGAGGWLVLGALFALCLLLTSALLGLGSGHVDSLVGFISAVWTAAVRIVRSAFEAFVRFMALFLKPAQLERQYIQQDSLAVSNIPAVEMGTAPQWVVTLILMLLGALILAGILALLFALRSAKFSRVRAARRRRKVTRKSHFLSALRALARRIADRVSFEIAYLLGRRTPQGLLVLAQRTGRLHRVPRRRSESGGAYMRRLDETLRAQGHPSTLGELADMLDALFYGGVQVSLTSEQAEAFAAQIRGLRALPAGEKNKPNA